MPEPQSVALPPEVDRRIRERLDPAERLVAAVAADLTAQLRFGERWLVATDRRLFSLEALNSSDPGVHSALREIESTEVEPAVGGGCLMIRSRKGAFPAAYFTHARIDPFTQFARIVRKL